MRYPEYWIKIRMKYPMFCEVKCNRCNFLMKKENVWKVKTNHLNNMKANSGYDIPWPVYYCMECFPEKDKLTEWVTSTTEKYRLK